MARHKETLVLGGEGLHSLIDYKSFVEKLRLEELQRSIEESPELLGKILGALAAIAVAVWVVLSLLLLGFEMDLGLDRESALFWFLSLPVEVFSYLSS